MCQRDKFLSCKLLVEILEMRLYGLDVLEAKWLIGVVASEHLYFCDLDFVVDE